MMNHTVRLKKNPLLCLMLVLSFATELPAQGVDFRILNHLQEHRTPAMNNVMSWTSNSLVLAPAVPIGLSVAGLAADNRDMLHAGCVTGLSFATAFLLTEGLKFTVQRPRPYLTYPDELHPVRTTFGYSFPSGHTFAAISGRALPFRRACRRTDRHRLRRAGLQPFKKLVAGFPATGHSLRHSGCGFVLIYPSRFHLIRGTRSHSIAHPCSNDRDNIHNNHHHLTLQNDR